MRKFIVRSSLTLLLLGTTAVAMTIMEAKAAGYVAEQKNGYLAVIDDKAPADVRADVETMNKKRRTYYEGIADKNNIPVQNVENIAGEKLTK